jgi:hypothetical protein
LKCWKNKLHLEATNSLATSLITTTGTKPTSRKPDAIAQYGKRRELTVGIGEVGITTHDTIEKETEEAWRERELRGVTSHHKVSVVGKRLKE